MERISTVAEVSGLALLTLGGAALLIAPAAQAHAAVSRRLRSLARLC